MLVEVHELNHNTYMVNPIHVIYLEAIEEKQTRVVTLGKAFIADENMYVLADRLAEEEICGS